MKHIELKLSGLGEIHYVHPILRPWMFCYDSLPSDLEMKGIIGPSIEVAVIESQVSIEVNGRHIRKSKGPYQTYHDYFAEKLPIPAVAYSVRGTRFDQVFKIPLEDDEKFSPKKLQLMKSKFEFPMSDYGIIATEIMYDGKIISGENPHPYEDLKRTFIDRRELNLFPEVFD